MKYNLKMHHIGLATESISQMKKYLRDFFCITDCGEEIYDSNQKAKLCMLTTEDGTKIELIEGEVVRSYIKKRNFFYHICYETEHMEQIIADLIERGGLLVSEPKKAVLFGNKRVAFLMTEMGLIELLESGQREILGED